MCSKTATKPIESLVLSSIYTFGPMFSPGPQFPCRTPSLVEFVRAASPPKPLDGFAPPSIGLSPDSFPFSADAPPLGEPGTA